MMVLEHLSSDEYIDLVRELNQTLPNNIEDWSNPEYVSTYVGTGMDSICSSVNEVIGGLARLGIAEPGPLVS